MLFRNRRNTAGIVFYLVTYKWLKSSVGQDTSDPYGRSTPAICPRRTKGQCHEVHETESNNHRLIQLLSLTIMFPPSKTFQKLAEGNRNICMVPLK